MRDGIGPGIRALFTTIGSGLIGIVHGAIDSSIYEHNMPELAHLGTAYLTPIISGIIVSTSKDGLNNTADRTGAAFAGAGLSTVASTLGYYGTRVLLSGIKKVFA